MQRTAEERRSEPGIELEFHRATIQGHCYRMLGSVSEADDATQETMIRAWRSLDRFEGRSSLRTWLLRIATRVCLDALEGRKRRELPIGLSAEGTTDAPLIELPASRWVEPIPDAKVIPVDSTPEEKAVLRESIRLAFIAALQHLTPDRKSVV